MKDYKNNFSSNQYMLAIMVILLIGIVFRAFYDQREIRESLEGDIASLHREIGLSFKDHIEHLEKEYILLSTSYQNSEVIQNLIRTKNHKELFKKIESDYKRYTQVESHLFVMHFIDTENITVLRMHKPESHSDDLTDIRPIVKYVNKEKIVQSGFEVGKNGITYRITIPLITQENEHLGVLEFGINPSYFSKELNYTMDIKSQIVVKTKYLQHLTGKKEFENIKEYSIIEKDPIFKNLNSKLNFNKSYQYLDIEDKNYVVFNDFNFKSFDGKGVSKIIMLKDITHLVDKYNRSVFIIYGMNLFIILIVILLFKRYSDESTRLHKTLKELNSSLEDKVAKQVKKTEKSNSLLFQKSRMAQMGEMISMIAHQWRQPLGAISTTSINLNMQIELETFDLEQEQARKEFKVYFSKGLNDIDLFVQNLSSTIDDFRNFYKPNKQQDIVFFHETINKALSIIRPSLISDNIEIVEKYICNDKAKIYSNEIMQVVLNILKNSQDNFKEKNIKDPKIIISCNCSVSDKISIMLCDNGGGVSEDVIENIFDPYFSTKSEKNGTGLGLYMSKIIVEDHHNGSLKVKNMDGGVCFTIEIDKE